MFYDDKLLFHESVPRIMGTRFDMLTHGTDKSVILPLWEEIKAKILHLEHMLDRFDPSSELARCNAGLASPSEELLALARMCGEYRDRTDGCFDIGKGVSGQMDFGGFAKGYVLRLIREHLDAAGVTCAFVDFGQSSILALGSHPLGGAWRVSLEHPFTRSVVGEAELVDCALSVSGNSPGYSGHIIDPRSMQPVVSHRMVAVRSGDPLDAEVLSTVLMMLPQGECQSMLARFEGAQARFFEAD